MFQCWLEHMVKLLLPQQLEKNLPISDIESLDNLILSKKFLPNNFFSVSKKI